jgi:hypothetical protein
MECLDKVHQIDVSTRNDLIMVGSEAVFVFEVSQLTPFGTLSVFLARQLEARDTTSAKQQGHAHPCRTWS